MVTVDKEEELSRRSDAARVCIAIIAALTALAANAQTGKPSDLAT